MGFKDNIGRKVVGGLDIIDGLSADKRIMSHIAKGHEPPKPKSANLDGFFSKAIEKAKKTSVGEKLTSNVGYKTTMQTVSDDTMDVLQNKISLEKTNELNKARETLSKLDPSSSEYTTASEAYAKKMDEVKRVQSIVSKGEFQRGYTPIEYAKSYYGDSQYGSFRRKATMGAIGAAGAIDVGVRLANGGTLTRDNEGNRDIVGVPFI